jgi:hypothetical protein
MLIMLALLQAAAAPDSKLYIVLGIVSLAALIALGLKLFTNLMEVISTPGASLAHLGRTDNFLFSFVLVLLAGLIGTLILIANQPQMSTGFHEFAVQLSQTAAQANSNATYREIAAEMGAGRLDGAFSVYVASNLVFYSVLAVVHWLVIGLLWFLIAKMLGGHATVGAFLGTVAYPYFFGVIGSACAMVGALSNLKAAAGGAPTADVLTIVGGVLSLYSVILLLAGVNQAAELGTARMIVGIIILLILLGGAGYGVYYSGQPVYSKWESSVKGYDPSKPGFVPPG